MTLQQTTNPKVSYSGCEVSGGMLRLLFNEKNIGTNISSVCNGLSAAVNDAGVAAAPEGAATLDFDAKAGIKKDYDPKIGGIKAAIQSVLGLPMLEIYPNFERNFAAISAWIAAGHRGEREWQRTMGAETLRYFDCLADTLKDQGFAKDEMLQEGFQESVDKNEIGLRVVEKLQNGSFNECVIENGVLYLQTTPQWWTTNTRDGSKNLMNML